MDREISKEVRRRERMKFWTKWGSALLILILLVSVLFRYLQPSLKITDLSLSTVDVGSIDISIGASGKVVPAFEEIINSPINSRILEVYKKGGDSVDVGTPILRLDLLSAETDYENQLNEVRMNELKLEQLRIQNKSKLSEMEMQLKV